MLINEGMLGFLGHMLRAYTMDTHIGLFKNDITLAVSTVLGDLVEPTFAGYERILAPSLTWPDPSINGDGQGECDSPTINWTLSGDLGTPEDIYGIFVTIIDETVTARLLFAARFTTPVAVAFTGDEVNKKLNFFDADLFP